MSDVGLNSSLYEQAHHWAVQIDNALIQLKANREIDGQSRNEIADLLIDLAGKRGGQTPTFFIVSQLRNKLTVSAKALVNVSNKLRDSNNDAQVISILEDIATALEQEQVSTMTRIQRWQR